MAAPVSQQPRLTDLVAKVHLLDIEEIRRVPVERDGLPSLQAFICRVLNVSDRNLVHLSYVDDENDMIRVTNGDEFKEAVSFHCAPPESSGRKPTRVVKLFARVAAANNSDSGKGIADAAPRTNSFSKTTGAAVNSADSLVAFEVTKKCGSQQSQGCSAAIPFTLLESDLSAASFFTQLKTSCRLPVDKNVWCTYEDEDGDSVRFHNDYSVRHAVQLARSRSPDKVVKVTIQQEDLPNPVLVTNRKRWEQCEFDDVVNSLNKLKANGFSDMSVCVELLAHFDNDVDAVMEHLRKEKK